MPYPNPSFGRAAYGAVFGGTPYGVGMHEQDSQYFDALGYKPPDAVAFGLQRAIVPMAAFAGALWAERRFSMMNQSSLLGATLTNGYAAKFFGGGVSGGMAKVGLSTGLGQRLGGGFASGLTHGAGAFFPGFAASRTAAGVVEAGTFVGGAAGFLAGPMLMAQGISTVADKFAFDPYLSVRENQNMLRGAFSGVTFGQGYGDPFSGRGLSRGNAARIGGELAELGMKDQTFDAREVASITDMAAQGGLLDNVMPDQISKRMSSLMRQMKVIMSVTGSTDFKEVVAMMSKMQMAGVDPHNMSSVITQIGNLSSAAGISTGRMMNTVGAQGQYLFQANGLTPYLGQLAAAGSMAGMATAFRSGLISPELMARMGGVEGATQSSLTGQVNASQNMYNMMRNFNRYNLNSGTTDVVDTISRFGHNLSRDPTGNMGLFDAGRGRNLSEQFKKEGVMGLHNQLIPIARSLNLLDSDGTLSAERAHAIMTRHLGMGNDEATAYLSEYAAMKDPKTRNLMIAGINSQSRVQMREYLERTGQTKIASIFQTPVGMYRDARTAITGGVSSMLGWSGDFTDNLQNWLTELQYGKMSNIMGTRSSDLVSGVRMFNESKLRDAESPGGPGRNIGSAEVNALVKINKLIEQGNSLALKAAGGDAKLSQNAISELARLGLIDSRYEKGEGFSSLMTAIGTAPRSSVDRSKEVMGKYFSDMNYLGEMMNRNDALDPIKQQTFAASAAALKEAQGAGVILDETTDPELRKHLEVFRSMYAGEANNEAGLKTALGYFGNVLRDKSRLPLNSKYFRPEDLDKHLSNASKLKGGSREYMEQFMRDNADFTLQAPGAEYTNKNTDTAEILQQRRRDEATNEQISKIMQGAKDGKIRVTEAYQLAAGIKFDSAVDKFGRYVDELTKKGVNVGPESRTGYGPNGVPVTMENPRAPLIPGLRINPPGGSTN